jgi:predicted ABC-type sugar transport system permease subunit
MPRNIGSIDLVIRSILGIALIAYVGKEGALMSAWGLVALPGAYLLATGILSYCPVYRLLDITTVERIDRSI